MSSLLILINFNPRSREGSDDDRTQDTVLLDISIHAPARGATDGFVGPCSIARFQSTLPRGERRIVGPEDAKEEKFQSTLPRGERRSGAAGPQRLFDDFNPRSREGSDIPMWPCLKEGRISIHAPARGATQFSIAQSRKHIRFQSTLPRGERRRISSYPDYDGKFQSTLPRGERLIYSDDPVDVVIISIHAPARGATF